ncbi:protein of unknown function, partial [Taphrina deformans PYCC 5710]
MSSAIIKCKFDLGSIDALDPSNSNLYSLEESETASTLISLSNHSAGTHQRAYANTTGLWHAGAWDGLISASYSACASWSDFFRFGSVGKADPNKEESGAESRKRSASALLVEEDQPIRKRLALSRPAQKPDSALLLKEARRMYGDPDLKWRSPEQESALLAIVAGDVKVTAILPTVFVYLTATLPPSMKDRLAKAHSLTRLNLIRSSTRRPAIEYSIRRLQTSSTSFLTSLSALIPDVWGKSERDGSDQAMLFVRSRKTAEQLAGLLSCQCYHSGTEDKAHAINAWKAGLRGPFIVGTSGLGTGLDYASVRLVVHVEEPYSLIDFAQESGRAGRDGQKAESLIVLLAGSGSQPAPPQSDLEDFSAM